jgi:hypothetical protein
MCTVEALSKILYEYIEGAQWKHFIL